MPSSLPHQTAQSVITLSNNQNRRRNQKRWSTSTIQCLVLTSVLFTLALWLSILLQFGSESIDESIPVRESIDEENISVKDHQFDVAATQQNQQPKAKATIAYAVSLTSCGSTTNLHDNIANGGHSSDPSFREGAAVLAHSIHLSSIRNFAQSGSHYDYKLIVFVHPNARACSDIFEELGYEIQIRDTPFKVADIKSEWLQEHIVKTGCCGEKEYLKLYSYIQFDYPIVIHLDLDSLILKPMDDLFDVMLADKLIGKEESIESARKRVAVMHDNPLPQSDYNMINPGKKHVGVQGGFLIVRPNQAAFDEYIKIVLSGNFRSGGGWGGQYGGYFGAQQIQGICSYFYDKKHPGTGVELNKCYYNVMADPPRQNEVGKCRDGREECQDCRDTPLEEIYSVHFTLPKTVEMSQKAMCSKFHGEWFRIREDLERVRALERNVGGSEVGDYAKPKGPHMPEIFRGFCKSGQASGYIPLQ
ncbi:glycogenin [Skeletonema marinoi]|uniref:Glycogenin n=1 Tax=Skeletonema marinoi TaxID=267567 RepID=A0AAD8YGH5_9STRA|nr:glycogenin [Skeletonema marinoi]